MDSKNIILNSIRKNLNANGGISCDMPDFDGLQGICYDDKLAQFIAVSRTVGANAVIMNGGEDINSLIKSLYPDAKNIASNLPEITVATVNPDELDQPRALNGIDLGIVRGSFGVAENGCIWIPQNVRHKAIYFVSEYLIIVLDGKNIVNNMHEAYSQIKFEENYGFGVFISGPSKTADIEQALVIGAHGAKGVTVILRF